MRTYFSTFPISRKSAKWYAEWLLTRTDSAARIKSATNGPVSCSEVGLASQMLSLCVCTGYTQDADNRQSLKLNRTRSCYQRVYILVIKERKVETCHSTWARRLALMSILHPRCSAVEETKPVEPNHAARNDSCGQWTPVNGLAWFQSKLIL